MSRDHTSDEQMLAAHQEVAEDFIREILQRLDASPNQTDEPDEPEKPDHVAIDMPFDDRGTQTSPRFFSQGAQTGRLDQSTQTSDSTQHVDPCASI